MGTKDKTVAAAKDMNGKIAEPVVMAAGAKKTVVKTKPESAKKTVVKTKLDNVKAAVSKTVGKVKRQPKK